VWSFAFIAFDDVPFLESLASASQLKLAAFIPQNIANLAWALAKCAVADSPLWDSIAAPALPRLPQFDARELANTAWSFAWLCLSHHQPLLDAIAAASRGMLDSGQETAYEHGALWAFWRSGISSSSDDALFSGAAANLSVRGGTLSGVTNELALDRAQSSLLARVSVA